MGLDKMEEIEIKKVAMLGEIFSLIIMQSKKAEMFTENKELDEALQSLNHLWADGLKYVLIIGKPIFTPGLGASERILGQDYRLTTLPVGKGECKGHSLRDWGRTK